jgi:hypothetical protein
MITIPRPSMSLNAPELLAYRLENNRTVFDTVTPFWLADNISAVAANATNNKLKVLVFNCHGVVTEKGEFISLAMGTGIAFKDLKHFVKLKELVENIFIVACSAAAGVSGKRFCGELARVAKANVFAGEEVQRTFGSDLQGILSGDVIDSFEGKIFEFGISGEGKPLDSVPLLK